MCVLFLLPPSYVMQMLQLKWSTGTFQHSSENVKLSVCIQFDYRKHGNLIALIVMRCHFTGQHAAEYQWAPDKSCLC